MIKKKTQEANNRKRERERERERERGRYRTGFPAEAHVDEDGSECGEKKTTANSTKTCGTTRKSQ
jgi:hypothetical protein